MKTRLRGRDRRVLLGGALVVGGIVGLGHGVPAAARWSHSAIRSAEELDAEVARAERSVATLSETRRRFAALRDEFVGTADRILGSAGAGDAERTLSGLVSGAAGRAGVSIGAIETSTDSARSGFFRVISARVEAEASQESLVRMLRLLESGRELLVFGRLVVERQEREVGPRPLRVRFLVQGLGAGSWDQPTEAP